MNCPNCGLINLESAIHCDCGYEFEYPQPEPMDSKVEEPKPKTKTSRSEIVVLGVWLILGPFLFFTDFAGDLRFEIAAYVLWFAGLILLLWRSFGHKI